MTMSLAKPRKLHYNRQPIRVLSLLVLGIFLIAGTHAISKEKGPVTIDPDNSLWAQAYDINDRGHVVGRVNREDGAHGFLLSKGKFTTIDIEGATHTEANGINKRGAIVGRYVADGVSHGYVLEDGEVTEIAFPGAYFSWPTAIVATSLGRMTKTSSAASTLRCTPSSGVRAEDRTRVRRRIPERVPARARGIPTKAQSDRFPVSCRQERPPAKAAVSLNALQFPGTRPKTAESLLTRPTKGGILASVCSTNLGRKARRPRFDT